MCCAPRDEFLLGKLQNPVLQAAADGDVEKLELRWTQNAITPFSPEQFHTPSHRHDPVPVFPDFPSITDIAIVAVNKHQPHVLEWCFDKGFILPRKSIMNEFYFACCGKPSIPIFQVLYEHNFDFNEHHFHVGGNILAVAVEEGDVEAVRWLLEHGHSPNISGCGYSMSAICDAIAGENPSLENVKLLLQHGLQLTGMPGSGRGGMLAAGASGNLEALRLLLDYGANLDERDGFCDMDDLCREQDEGCTPLWLACSKGHVEVVRFLLEEGADPGAENKMGVTCVEAATEGGHEEIVRLLKGNM